jgi:protoporphyrinogen oxidase
MKVGILGGGMTGLATAHYLSRKGIHVTVLEKDREIGGLSRSEEIMPGLQWDRFYHVILSTDKELLEFVDEIGLAPDVQFRETLTGFYTDGKLHSMSNTKEFLNFEPLSLLDKLRLGVGILYTSRINNWKRLEKIYVKNWLVRVFGRRNYEKMWDPLLRCKLGAAKDHASAAFIWASIKRYYDTRHTSSKKELMGCVRGGYYSILNNVRDRLLENGSTILVDQGVEKVEQSTNGTMRIEFSEGKPMEFDRVVATIPSPEITRICPGLPEVFKVQLEKVRYLSLICVTLVLRRPLTPFYVTNLTDEGFPFTGLIEVTNVIPREVLGDKTLIYLPRYMPIDDPFYMKSDEQVFKIFFRGLKSMFPDLSEEHIIAKLVHRERYVQPIHEVQYSEKVPPMQTPIDNLYMVNTTMILNSTLNNNQVIQLARKMANLILQDLK